MTDRAILGEIPLHMVGINSPVEITLMAAVAFSRQTRKLIIDMACCAKDRGVRAVQREIGLLEMVPLRAIPGNIIMAGRACGRKAESNVCRIGSRVEISDMAVVAIGANVGISLAVAAVASDNGMPAVQRKRLGVLICSALPTGRNRQMASLAIAAETRLGVVRIRGRVEILQVATLTGKRCSSILVDLLADMACVAVSDLMYPHQGESFRSVQIDHIPVIFPVPGRMALITVGTELRPMYIRVAVRAGRTDHGKFQILVAVSAVDM